MSFKNKNHFLGGGRGVFLMSYSVNRGDSDYIEKNISGIENLEVGAITRCSMLDSDLSKTLLI